MSHATGVLWLKISSILLIVLGALFSWGTVGILEYGTITFLDFVILPFDGAQGISAVETKLLIAITGGLTAGFGMAIYMMTAHIYASDQASGSQMILATTFTWFVIDGIGSVLAGVTFNVIANLSFLIMVALPVLLVKYGAKTSTV